MFRKMRREKQSLSEQEIQDILIRNTAGVLALLGDDEYPYSVPMSYVYDNGKFYFHSALSGHKIDAVKQHQKASFCIIDQDDIIPEEYTTYYRSVIAFGSVRILDSIEEKKFALEVLAEKYSPLQVEGRAMEIEKGLSHVAMIEFLVEHLTGKEASELVKLKE